MSFAVSAIAANIELGVAARDRRWWERALGRRPAGVSSPLSSAHERAGAHVEPHSVWLHNSLRGAFALSLAVLVAGLAGVQHSFWVVFGTLTVLRSNALLTGQNALRALLGTVDLWERDDETPAGDHTAVRAGILRTGARLCDWYQQTARTLAGYGEVPDRLPHDESADGRLIEAVRRDLTGKAAQGTGTAIRMIWTADHIDVARRLQTSMLEPARAVAALQDRMRTATGPALLRRRLPHSRRT
jgi:hypothetical protein